MDPVLDHLLQNQTLHFTSNRRRRNACFSKPHVLVQSEIKDLFPTTPEGLEEAKRNSADFFIQICDGYPHFNERRGAPMMNRRHQPFAIDAKARVVWLENFALALEPVEAPEELKQSFWNYLDIFSAWMINR